MVDRHKVKKTVLHIMPTKINLTKKPKGFNFSPLQKSYIRQVIILNRIEIINKRQKASKGLFIPFIASSHNKLGGNHKDSAHICQHLSLKQCVPDNKKGRRATF